MLKKLVSKLKWFLNKMPKMISLLKYFIRLNTNLQKPWVSQKVDSFT